ncbi:reverse transcriptase domain-containing protein [Tanacetum coccineum]
MNLPLTRVMDPNSSLGKICLGEDVVVISSDKVEGPGDWNSPEFQDTANSGQKKETKAMVFYQMETEEVSDRFVAPCFVNGLEAYDVEINLGVEENMISNEYAVNVYRLEIKLKMNNQCRTSSSAGGHLTQEEAAKEAIAIKMSRKCELDGKIVKKEEEAVKRIKREALKEKDDPGAFIFPIRLEGQVNENALANTGSDINTMPYRIYEQLGREDMKKVDRGITMINHTQAEAMGMITNVLCQVGVTTLIAKFLILDILIDRDSPIVVGQGFLRTIGGIVNTSERLFSTFDGFCHQTFRAARSNVMRNAESDSDDEEDYQIKRNKFRAPIYGPKPAPYLNCNDPDERSLAIQTESQLGSSDYKGSYNKVEKRLAMANEIRFTDPYGNTMGTHDDEAGSSRSKRSRQHETVEEDLLNRMGCDGEIDDILRIRLHEAESDEEIFTSLQTKKIIKFKHGGRAHSLTLLEFARRLGLYHADELKEDGFNVYFEGGLRSDEHFNARKLSLSIILFISKIARKCRVLTEDVVRSLSTLIYCRDLDTITLRDLIDSDGKLILGDPQLGVPIVGIPRPPRASMYQGVFEHMTEVYSVPMQGAYNPPGYAQPQYDQYYQQYPPLPP